MAILGLLIFSIAACVPQRKYQDTKMRLQESNEENKNCREKLGESMKKNDEYQEEIGSLRKESDMLKRDTSRLSQEYNRVHKLNKNLNELYEKVISQNKDLLATSTAQNQKLELELANKQRELEIKEKYLKDLETSLKAQEANINKLNEDLKEREKNINSLTGNLQEREARVNELEALINRKDSAVNALKQKISKALLGFKENELTVEMKNGKVYVSLAEQLLFGSGSTTVDEKGKDALQKLASVLAKNQDINILIEGHTDDVPIKTGSIKDNWDLSVLRATSIVRILSQNNKIDPKRITAAGRGEFVPVSSNDSKTGKQKNRRTEIILTPDLDELFKLLESN